MRGDGSSERPSVLPLDENECYSDNKAYYESLLQCWDELPQDSNIKLKENIYHCYISF